MYIQIWNSAVTALKIIYFLIETVSPFEGIELEGLKFMPRSNKIKLEKMKENTYV